MNDLLKKQLKSAKFGLKNCRADILWLTQQGRMTEIPEMQGAEKLLVAEIAELEKEKKNNKKRGAESAGRSAGVRDDSLTPRIDSREVYDEQLAAIERLTE